MVWFWWWVTAMAATGEADLLDEQTWSVVNDTVMGGHSQGSVQVAPLRFTGELVVRDGGFASVRSEAADLNLDAARALRVTLVGDGRTWQVTAHRRDVPIRAGSYRMAVDTTGEVQEITLPLADFQPTSRGRRVWGAPTLDAAPGRIHRLGFLLADGTPGPFALEVRSVVAVGPAEPRGGDPAAVQRRLQEAIRQGVPLFNAGDAAACRDVYAEVLRSVHAGEALTAGEHEVVREALAIEADDPEAAAWALRHAIDTVLAGLTG